MECSKGSGGIGTVIYLGIKEWIFVPTIKHGKNNCKGYYLQEVMLMKYLKTVKMMNL